MGKKRKVKRFSFVFFIHHCKTVIKTDQTSSFYPSINDILYKKYLKKRKCHCVKQKREYRILKVPPVSSFALAFPVYISLVVNNYFASQSCTTECTVRFSQDLIKIVADRPLLSCDLDVSIQLLGWIVLMNYFNTRRTTVFDLSSFYCFAIGFNI